MEPAHNSETTMSERPYLTFRNASRRARGRGMARVAAAREERCKTRRCVVATTEGRPKPRGALLTRYGCLVTPENTSDSNVFCSDPFYAGFLYRCYMLLLLAWQWRLGLSRL